MKMMKKSFGMLAVVFAFCMLFAVSVKVDAAGLASEFKAGTAEGDLSVRTQDVSAGQIAITGMAANRSWINVTVNRTYNNNYTCNQVRVTLNGKVVKEGYMVNSAGYPITTCGITGLKKNKVYKVYARTAVAKSNGTIAYSKWSAAKTVVTATYKGNKISSKSAKGFWLKAPKISGVKNYKVYIKKGNGKYKKVKTIKPGKKVKITKFKGKSFKLGYYYIKITPVLKKGSCTGPAAANNSYDFRYRVYKY